jgi:hypothetical protein
MSPWSGSLYVDWAIGSADIAENAGLLDSDSSEALL